MVWAREPLYLTPDSLSLLCRSTVVLTREEFARNLASAPLDMRDSYGLYGANSETGWVGLVSPAEMRALPEGARRELLHLQWRMGRGQEEDLTVTQYAGDRQN